MKIIFADGIGGGKIYRLSLLRVLRKLGHQPVYFSYKTFVHNFEAIRHDLLKLIIDTASHGDYCLVGYSFGGILMRAALQEMPLHVRQPKHLFLLGSPVFPSTISMIFKGCVLYRLLTGDCGQLAASSRRMKKIHLPDLPITCIYGTSGISGIFSPFGAKPNDGMVSVEEICPSRFGSAIGIPVSHPFLPSSPIVPRIIAEQLYEEHW